MRVEFTPGSLFKVLVREDGHAYALMLSVFPYVAFYGENVSMEEAGFPSEAPMFIIVVARTAYASGGWGSPLRRLAEEFLPAIPRFFWQSPVKKSECKIVEPIKRRVAAAPGECVGLEPEAVWSQEHIEARIIDTYAGRPNAFLESLRVRL
ncbi:hypothetical protein [Actinomadura sp. DC4]|uniref:hypothetical protein n=1 Tax=Actinomadura sp. DC4 TaxID=3055069 RepID=UPI0025AFBC6C|nr:hypothetical protein [Actinomadura sp. DC4]MDN3353783.1 hypothetical protein [Actinomadura sp. DC4]